MVLLIVAILPLHTCVQGSHLDDCGPEEHISTDPQGPVDVNAKDVLEKVLKKAVDIDIRANPAASHNNVFLLKPR